MLIHYFLYRVILLFETELENAEILHRKVQTDWSDINQKISLPDRDVDAKCDIVFQTPQMI